jgi:4-amino-4-deoxy-L-arabinose transferase-like glycosyltransferase
MAAAKNAGTVLALRIVFGFASAFLQALTLYITMWYKRNEMATRTGIVSSIFLSLVPLLVFGGR